jgi:hypothetical protein
MHDDTDVVAAMRKCVRSRGWTITEAAMRAGVNRGKLGAYLRGDGPLKDCEWLRLARAINPEMERELRRATVAILMSHACKGTAIAAVLVGSVRLVAG